MGDAVGLVVEHAGIELIEIAQGGVLQDHGVDLCHTVDAVGTDDGQASHMHEAALNDGDGAHLVLVARIALPDELQVTVVDLLDDHVDAGQQLLEHIHRPGFQCFRQDSMVGVSHSVAHHCPCFIPFHLLLIHKDAHELRHDESRVCIVDMQGNLLGEVAQSRASLLVVADNALDTGGYQEVLLDQAALAPLVAAVIGIQVAGDILHEPPVLLLLLQLLMGDEAVVGEVPVHFCVPEAQVVDRVVVIAYHRHIIGHSHDGGGVLIYKLQFPIAQILHVGIAEELDINGLISLAILPGKAILQPVVGNLSLLAINNLLLEEPELIMKAAAVACQAVSCHGVDEAGSQATQAAIAQACIRFFFIDIRKLQLEIILKNFLHSLFDTKIDKVGLQKASQQELNGEVINLLFLTLVISTISLDPVIGNVLLGNRGHRLIDLILGQFMQLAAPHDVYRADEAGLQLCLELLICLILDLIDFLFLCQKKHSPSV